MGADRGAGRAHRRRAQAGTASPRSWPARTLHSASSSRAVGAPQAAMTASPYRVTMALAISKQRVRASRLEPSFGG